MKKVYSALLLMFFSVTIFAQKTEKVPDFKKESFKKENQLFRAYVAAGLSLSQIDGDNSAGYNNVGANAGVGTFIVYSKKFSNSIEISYSMRGARSKFLTGGNTIGTFAYSMDYVEVPILFNYHDFKVAMFHAGLSFSGLVRLDYQKHGVKVPVDTKNPNYYSWNMDMVLGFTFLIKKHWGINFKFNYSLLNNLKVQSGIDSNGQPIYDTPRGGLIGKQSARNSNRTIGGTNWYHNVLSIRAMYIF